MCVTHTLVSVLYETALSQDVKQVCFVHQERAVSQEADIKITCQVASWSWPALSYSLNSQSQKCASVCADIAVQINASGGEAGERSPFLPLWNLLGLHGLDTSLGAIPWFLLCSAIPVPAKYGLCHINACCFRNPIAPCPL